MASTEDTKSNLRAAALDPFNRAALSANDNRIAFAPALNKAA